MASAPRTYRAPIVITLAAAACIPACGGETSDDGGSGGSDTGGMATGGMATGGKASGGQSTGGRATGGQGAGGAGGSTGGQPSGGRGGEEPSGGAGGGSPLHDCPEDYFFPMLVCTPEARCETAMGCTSGEDRSFQFECSPAGDRWVFDGGDCENPFEFCGGSGHTLCVEETWYYQGQGGNPPAPCPEHLPEEGEDCSAGSGFGADRDACGYPCGDAWTVIGCVAADQQVPRASGSWVSDGTCSAGGAGGD